MERKTYCLILAALFAALTAVGAFLKLPLGALSLTLQFLFTALAGVLLGAKWGAISQLVYVALGLVGLPVFTAGGGLGYVFQPSFGFLLGLIPAAWVIGHLSKEQTSYLRLTLACVAGLAVLYLVGLPYMALILNGYLEMNLSLSTILWTGMAVYLPGDALKILVTVLVTKPLRKALPQTRTEQP